MVMGTSEHVLLVMVMEIESDIFCHLTGGLVKCKWLSPPRSWPPVGLLTHIQMRRTAPLKEVTVVASLHASLLLRQYLPFFLMQWIFFRLKQPRLRPHSHHPELILLRGRHVGLLRQEDRGHLGRPLLALCDIVGIGGIRILLSAVAD